MDPPSLRTIAARKVAYSILKGVRYQSTRVLCDDESNIIFNIIKEERLYLDDEEEDNALRVMLSLAGPTVMDFNNHKYSKMTEKDLELIKDQNLMALTLADTSELKKYIKQRDEPAAKKLRLSQPKIRNCDPYIGQDYFDILALLDENLNPATKRSLQSLNISKWTSKRCDFPFEDNWTQSISQMLPNLTTFKVAGQNVTLKEFGILCNSFPNLQTLDISATGLRNLTGLAKLENLTDLTMGSLMLNATKYLNDLYELKKLRRLDLNGHGMCHCGRTCKSDIVDHFSRTNKSIPSLVEFDCSKTETTSDELKRIVERHPTLRRIIANGCYFEELPVFDGIEFLCGFYLKKLLLSLDYFNEHQNYNRILKIFFYITRKVQGMEVWKEENDDVDEHDEDEEDEEGLEDEEDEEEVETKLTLEKIRPVIMKIYHSITFYEHRQRILEVIWDCCHFLAREGNLPVYENCDKRVLMECLMMLMDLLKIWNRALIGQNSWNFFNQVLRSTEDPQTDRIVKMAIDYFLYNVDEKEDFGLCCLETIDHLVEKADLSSDYYKGVDKKKLIDSVKKIHKECSVNKGMKKAEKEEAAKKKELVGRVMIFFEKFSG